MARSEPDHVGDPAQLLRKGRIVSVNCDAARCTVAVGDPDSASGEVVTGDVRWAAIRAGKTIVWSPPSEGEQVMLLAPDGDIAQAVAIPAIYCAAFPAPGNGTREFVRFEDEAEFGYDPQTHAADVTLPDGGTLTLAAPGGVTITGDVAITGDVSLTGKIDASGDVKGAGISLQHHKHPGVQSGSAQTGEPQ